MHTSPNLFAHSKLRLFQSAIEALPASPSDDSLDHRWFRAWIIELREEAKQEIEQVQTILEQCFLKATIE